MYFLLNYHSDRKAIINNKLFKNSELETKFNFTLQYQIRKKIQTW